MRYTRQGGPADEKKGRTIYVERKNSGSGGKRKYCSI